MRDAAAAAVQGAGDKLGDGSFPEKPEAEEVALLSRLKCSRGPCRAGSSRVLTRETGRRGAQAVGRYPYFEAAGGTTLNDSARSEHLVLRSEKQGQEHGSSILCRAVLDCTVLYSRYCRYALHSHGP